MDNLLKKAAGAAKVKVDPREGAAQTMKEHTVEVILADKVKRVAGAELANKASTQKAIEKVADKIGDKVPSKVLAAAAATKSDHGSEGRKELLGKAMGFLGKK